MKSLRRVWAENLAIIGLVGGVGLFVMADDFNEIVRTAPRTDYSARMQQCSEVDRDPNSRITIPCLK